MTTKTKPADEGPRAKENVTAGCCKSTKFTTVCQANIPQALKKIPHWIVWKAVNKNGKITKVPYSITGKAAKSDDPSTWTTYEKALTAYKAGSYDGIGFVFSQDDPFCGIDLDHCLDPETGKIEPWANEIIKIFDSYTEKSPSERGFHIIVKGRLPEGGRKKGSIEIYNKGRYFTFTGNHRTGSPADIRPAQDAIDSLLASHFKKEVAPQASPPSPSPGASLDDSELIDKAISAGNGHKFDLLYRGQWQEAGYPSQSEADQALSNMLAFWTGRDSCRIDNIFRQSGLMRPKWDKRHHSDGSTYGQGTIEKAISSCQETYSGKQTYPQGGFDGCSDTDESVEGLPEREENGIGLRDNGQKVSKVSKVSKEIWRNPVTIWLPALKNG